MPMTNSLTVRAPPTSFTIQGSGVWTMSPVVVYTSLRFRGVPKTVRDVRARIVTVYSSRVATFLKALKYSPTMIMPRSPRRTPEL